MPCTTILAGPKATEDGALYISRNEDCSPDDAKRLVYQPAMKNAEGAVFRSFRNDFTWPLPPESLAYLSVSDSATDGASEGEAGFNEAASASPRQKRSSRALPHSRSTPISRKPV